MNKTTIGLLPIPYDENSSFVKGPAQAPQSIIKILNTGSLNKSCENGETLNWGSNIVQLPEVQIPSKDHFVSAIVNATSNALSDGYSLLCLGGDHSVSYPIVKSIHAHYGKVNIIHFDAHPDLYHEFKGNKFSNACPFARIMEEDLVKSLHQYGIRTLNDHLRQQAKKFGVHVNDMRSWPCSTPDLDGPVYISIDIDAIDPAYAPGVSHREPGGLSPRDIINFIHQIDAPVIGVDIVEYNPDKDIDDLTAYVVAKLVKEAAGKILQS